MNALARLEAMPLLGSSKAGAAELSDQLAYQVNPDTHPEDALRILICRFLASESTPETLAQLATAEAWATQEGFSHIATRIQLLWFAEIGRTNGEAVDEQLFQTAVDTATRLNMYEIEVHLAKAACTSEHRDTHLQAALKQMSEPRWASLAYRAWLDLADVNHDGSDTPGAEEALAEALKLAKQYNDPSCEIESRSRIALHLIDRGLASTAQPHLEEAQRLARAEEDDLSTVMLSGLLCPMYMSQEAWAEAEQLADIMLVAGARRANWYAAGDGHITRSTLSLIHADPAGAISRLVRATVHLRELVPAADIDFLKGRHAELRRKLGNEALDTHFSEAMALNATT